MIRLTRHFKGHCRVAFNGAKMKKKGMAWLEWILLMAIMAGLAIGTVIWAREKTESWTQSSVDYLEGEMECNDVKIKATNNSELTCTTVNVTNKGMLVIDSIELRYADQREVTKNFGLKPFNSKLLNTNSAYNQVEVIPIAKVNDKLFICKSKKAIVTCP